MVKWQLITIIILFVAFLWEGKLGYSLAYLFLSLFFLGYHWHSKASKKIQVSRSQGEHRYFPQEMGEMTIQVQNNSPFPFPWISLKERIPQGLLRGKKPDSQVFALPGGFTTELKFNLNPSQRGVYRLGPVELSVGDLFGLNTETLLVQNFQTVIVYPQIYPLRDLAILTYLPIGNLQARQKIYPDPTRLGGVRPYEQGDPLRTVHWAATARTQELQVKQFEHTVTANSLVFLNLNEEDYDVSGFFATTELAISTAASLSSALIEAGETCGLVTNGTLTEYLPDEKVSLEHGILHLQPRRGLGQLTEILTILAGIEPRCSPFLDLVRLRTYKLQPGTVLIWIVPQDTKELVAEAKKWTHLGMKVFIFVVGKEITHPEFLDRPRGSIQVFPVRPEGSNFG